MIVGIVLTVALLLFLIAFPRHLKPVVAALAVVWACLGGWVLFDWVRYGERLEKIIATAAYDPTCRDENAPIRVSFQNTNDVAVERLTYTLEGFEPAFRAPISLEAYQPNERRLGPHESYAACRPFRLRSNEQADPARLEWRVTVNSADFE
ncbi:hypothetical protein [Agrobacterium larrymoorei]|uniref:hypothetical protein n=1 Tax=Agrobacterium larrymoorei TaxID=160699 RepID=UPI0030C3D99E